MFKSISDFFVYLMNGKSQEELDKENVTTEVEEENSDVGLTIESDSEGEGDVGLPLESDSEEELENVVVEEEKKGLLSFLRAEEKNEEEEKVEEEENVEEE